MAQLPDQDKHSWRSITGAPPPKYIQTLICTCKKKHPLFRDQYQPDIHYIVPVNSAILLCKKSGKQDK